MSPGGPSSRRRIAGERSRTTAPETRRKRFAPPKPAGKQPAPKTRPAARTTTDRTRPATKVRTPSGLRPPRHALRWLVPLAVLTVLAVAFAVVMGTRGVSDYRETKGIDEARDVAASQAGAATETVFSFKYDALDKHLAQSKKLMTGSFSTEFEKIAPALTELAPQRKIDVKASTRSAAVEECGDDCSPDKATVLVFFDQSRTMPGSKLPTVFGQRVELTMKKQDGTWLVDDIKAL